MTPKHALVYSLKFTGGMVGMFTRDLSRQELHHRIAPAANPAGWILGHLIVLERQVLQMLGVGDERLPTLPFDDFEKRFGRGEDAPAASDFGEVELLPRLFKEHRDALISAVEAADEAEFDKPLPRPMRMANTLGEMLAFMPVHVAMHMGQVTSIRRSLGKPPLV